MTHAFTLYRSGYSPSSIPDNQLWADVPHAMFPVEGTQSLQLYPRYGSAASYYRVDLMPNPGAAPEDNWLSFNAHLHIDNYSFGVLPLSWYVGNPSDWPSGGARFPDGEGIRDPSNPWNQPSYRGVWSLHARRAT
jgi:hypothetical protein